MPHPSAKNVTTYHEILGYIGDELLCHHTQTLPGGGMIDCRYIKSMRTLLAKQFDPDMPLAEEEVKIISESFPIYCQVIQ